MENKVHRLTATDIRAPTTVGEPKLCHLKMPMEKCWHTEAGDHVEWQKLKKKKTKTFESNGNEMASFDAEHSAEHIASLLVWRIYFRLKNCFSFYSLPFSVFCFFYCSIHISIFGFYYVI